MHLHNSIIKLLLIARVSEAGPLWRGLHRRIGSSSATPATPEFPSMPTGRQETLSVTAAKGDSSGTDSGDGGSGSTPSPIFITLSDSTIPNAAKPTVIPTTSVETISASNTELTTASAPVTSSRDSDVSSTRSNTAGPAPTTAEAPGRFSPTQNTGDPTASTTEADTQIQAPSSTCRGRSSALRATQTLPSTTRSQTRPLLPSGTFGTSNSQSLTPPQTSTILLTVSSSPIKEPFTSVLSDPSLSFSSSLDLGPLVPTTSNNDKLLGSHTNTASDTTTASSLGQSATSETSIGSLSLSSSVPTSSTTSVTRTVTPTGSIDNRVPTLITSIPSSTGTVSPDTAAANLAQAKEFNKVYSELTEASVCAGTQIACIKGDVAICKGNSFEVTDVCESGTSCFALPMNTTSGVQVGCFENAVAATVLGTSITSTATSLATSRQLATPVPSEITSTIQPTITRILTVTVSDIATAVPVITFTTILKTTLRRSRSASPAPQSPVQDGTALPETTSASSDPTHQTPDIKPGKSRSRSRSSKTNVVPIIPIITRTNSLSATQLFRPTNLAGEASIPLLSSYVTPTITVFVTVTREEDETETVAIATRTKS